MALIEVSSPTGQTLYVHIRNATGQIWNGSSFENYDFNRWATAYGIPLTEDTSSGYYHAAMPAIPAQKLTVLAYAQLGGAQAAGDDPAGSFTRTWNGADWIVGSVDVTSINGSPDAAILLGLSANTIINGTVVTGTLTTAKMTTNLSSSVDKFYFGRIVIFTSGSLTGTVAAIASYTGSSKLITFLTPVTSAPANGDKFLVL